MIDKYQRKLFVFELDSLNNPLKGNGMMPVLINDFSDAMLENCTKEKVININDVYTSGTFNSVANYGEENFEKILKNFKSMHFLSSIKIKDLALKEKQFEAIGKWSNEKILETYIKINGEYRNCQFMNNWMKK